MGRLLSRLLSVIRAMACPPGATLVGEKLLLAAKASLYVNLAVAWVLTAVMLPSALLCTALTWAMLSYTPAGPTTSTSMLQRPGVLFSRLRALTTPLLSATEVSPAVAVKLPPQLEPALAGEATRSKEKSPAVGKVSAIATVVRGLSE